MGRVALHRAPVLAVVVASLLAGATACGERSEPTGRTAGLYPVTIQTGDRPLVVTGPATRIAVLDQPAEDIVRSLGAGGRIVVAAPQAHIDPADLRRARPDLIVASTDADERDLSRAASATRAPVYAAPGDSIRLVERAITQLGLLTGRPVRARALVRHIESDRHEIDARLARTPNVTVFVDTGLLTTVSDQSLIGDLIREAHGTNVAGSTGTGTSIEPADLLRLDPDVYLTTSDTMLTLADLRANTRLRKLRAVKEGRFAVVDAELLAPGPSIGEGLAQVARVLHPDATR